MLECGVAWFGTTRQVATLRVSTYCSDVSRPHHWLRDGMLLVAEMAGLVRPIGVRDHERLVNHAAAVADLELGVQWELRVAALQPQCSGTRPRRKHGSTAATRGRPSAMCAVTRAGRGALQQTPAPCRRCIVSSPTAQPRSLSAPPETVVLEHEVNACPAARHTTLLSPLDRIPHRRSGPDAIPPHRARPCTTVPGPIFDDDRYF
jgi:hypothetical protein